MTEPRNQHRIKRMQAVDGSKVRQRVVSGAEEVADQPPTRADPCHDADREAVAFERDGEPVALGVLHTGHEPRVRPVERAIGTYSLAAANSFKVLQWVACTPSPVDSHSPTGISPTRSALGSVTRCGKAVKFAAQPPSGTDAS